MYSSELNEKLSQAIQKQISLEMESRFRKSNQIISDNSDGVSNQAKSTAYYDLYLLHRHGLGGALQNGKRAIACLEKAINFY